jgi:hypothetical protein
VQNQSRSFCVEVKKRGPSPQPIPPVRFFFIIALRTSDHREYNPVVHFAQFCLVPEKTMA